ncbi:hypothetical protein EZV73_10740 [Acidaminobacter sp. JC074]|uniref:non-canonical purine NTP pyrophosphatase n=1 Tax=Acidaminobacter sp. JC074 TaxID=2530199 RepID=UPI001F0E9CFE|nr:non-canonical purine NTP pyrophosphatase [Acidaminobacter sp. JC074]MCH4888054.1 hypothetical protein [Acidaminobacter sp. JC074]
MTKILYGTGNPAKLNGMRNTLAPLGIEVIGLNDLSGDLPEIDENGREPLDNARIKSLAYYKAFKMPVFSLDSGLYFVEDPHLEQPGTYIRRYTGVHMDDDQMIEHYRCLAKSNGGQIKGQYINGIVLVLDEDHIYEHQGEDISFKSFYLTDACHERRVEGFPLNSITKDVETGEFVYDMKARKNDGDSQSQAFRNFFKKHLNLGE